MQNKGEAVSTTIYAKNLSDEFTDDGPVDSNNSEDGSLIVGCARPA
jgi:hypothetical protein